jgi:L-threonylcarbamoyladenylate synthase
MITGEEAVELLREGRVVAVPTETVYGLAADALNPEAIARVFAIKNRPADNPLICHFSSLEMIRPYVKEISETTEKLMRHFTPGPISFMLDLPADSPLRFATCGSAQVIVRIPDHPLTLRMIASLNRPVAAPSANTSGKVSPTSVTMVKNDLGDLVDALVDGGDCRIGLESTIVDARNPGEIFLLRHGAIGRQEISAVLPKVVFRELKPDETVTTPGSKYRHYAPETPVTLIHRIGEAKQSGQAALLLTEEDLLEMPEDEKKFFPARGIHFVVLGSRRRLNELAKNFYSQLASLDRLNVKNAFLLKNDFGHSSLAQALQTRIQKITGPVSSA